MAKKNSDLNFYWNGRPSQERLSSLEETFYNLGWYQKRRKTRRQQRLITERDLPSTTMLLPCSSLGTLD